MNGKEALEGLLRNRSLKVTPKRLELLSLIANYGSAIPYSIIQQRLDNFDRVTLYRTIKALIDSGIIHKASVSSEDTYYALCRHSCSNSGHHHKHVHFKCNSCAEVSCLDVSSPIEINIPNVVVQQVEIEVNGICQKCI